jgi:hypothetical protein
MVITNQAGETMKTKTFTLLILFFSFYFVLCFAEEKKISVIVEGEEEVNTETAKNAAPTTQQGVYILKTDKQIENDKKELKKIVENPKIEGEIIDAIISKIIDLEKNQQSQMKFILFLSITDVLLLLIIIFMIVKKKR